MAIKLVKIENGVYTKDGTILVKEFIVDSDADFANLPKAAPGSTALSPSGKVMIVNASGEWVKFGG
ncbi:MAG: hypothetical protein IIX86_01155 [Clostridia bacterium]|nr:hypothetical protein [Clostridia bacterium]